jgi:hypothetical protein
VSEQFSSWKLPLLDVRTIVNIDFKLPLACVIVSAVLAFTASCPLIPPTTEITDEELSTLKKICAEVPTPQFFTKVRSHAIEKPNVVVYSTQYTSKEDHENVRKYFESEGFFQGWAQRTSSSAGTVYVDFRKGSYKVTLEYQILSLTDERVFFVSCSWGLS